MPDRWLIFKRALYSAVIVALAAFSRASNGNTDILFVTTVVAILIINFVEVREVELAGLVTLSLLPQNESEDDDGDE
jgi:hypothetical protein